MNSLQNDEKVSEYREKYAGSQAERSSKSVADTEATEIANQLESIALSGNYLENFFSNIYYKPSTQCRIAFLPHILEKREKFMLVNLLVNCTLYVSLQ